MFGYERGLLQIKVTISGLSDEVEFLFQFLNSPGLTFIWAVIRQPA